MSSYGGSYSNISSILKTPTAMEQLIEEINFQRAKEMRQLLKDDGYGGVQGTTYWTDLFVRHFLFQTELSIDCDDLLFFVRKKHIKTSSRFLPKFETEVEVFRKDSKKLPIGDPDIDWEETVYLNLIIHQFDYKLTLAICTRTSPKQLQILRRHSQKVYASPSRRRMDIKGDAEDMTYPYICFMVDNFDEVFSDMMVRDGEMVCVELVASDREGSTQGVIFLGSIRYDALKWVYEARASTTTKMSQRMTFGLFSSSSSGRIEYVRMKGPDGKGHAEMAVSKPPGAGCETPTSEPGFCAVDMWDQDWNQDPEDFFLYRHQRRLSDPSANINYFVRGGWKSKPDSAGARARSENEGLDSLANTMTEIEAGDVRDELDDGAYNPLWTMKGFTQTFHFWKENKRAQSVPLNAFLTYVTLPWWTIARVSVKGGRNREGQLKKFRSFILTVDAAHGQSDDPVDPEGSDSPLRVGTFVLYSDERTQYHDECVNAVKESDAKEKTEVQVMWQAPPKGSGCVTFRAMVLVDKDTWFADEGALTKKICEITPEYLRGDEEPEGGSLECCSCDEAKYTMVFEGLWSSATHPKDYPTNLWLTHFSDVIGATHGKNFSFWGEGQIASDGLRQVAEWGSARGLETELRAKARHLRTLIKAGGLWHPRVNENTTGSFRVDRRRNLLSVVSMFGPSPDWIVGVSGLNLCERDCTWTENKVVDLYPYDAGTDSGITYMSPNEPTSPRERIHRITPLYPEDPRSPFYDPQGKPMKPLAKLYLKLETVTPKRCTEEVEGTVDLPPVVDWTENTEDTRRPECNVTDYAPWSACSVTCGKGIRMRTRSYLMPQKAQMLGCDRQLVSKEMCVAEQASCSDGPFQYPSPFQYLPDSEELIEDTEAYCETSPFGEWSECSTTCGVGVAMRTRRFLDRWGRKKCPHVSLVEKRECIEPPCPPPSPGINMDPRCTTSEWTDWTPCSVTCGTGLRYRSRRVLVGGELKDICAGRVELNQQRICTLQADCSIDRVSAKQICMLEPDSGPCRGFFERWYFDPREKRCITFPYGGCRGNRNNFKLESECTEACGSIRDELVLSEAAASRGDGIFHGARDGTKIDCVVDEWSEWTPCSVSCGQGKSVRMRTVKVQPQNGGRPCPKRLLKKRICQGPPCPF